MLRQTVRIIGNIGGGKQKWTIFHVFKTPFRGRTQDQSEFWKKSSITLEIFKQFLKICRFFVKRACYDLMRGFYQMSSEKAFWVETTIFQKLRRRNLWLTTMFFAIPYCDHTWSRRETWPFAHTRSRSVHQGACAPHTESEGAQKGQCPLVFSNISRKLYKITQNAPFWTKGKYF